jgi:hypothetical protein
MYNLYSYVVCNIQVNEIWIMKTHRENTTTKPSMLLKVGLKLINLWNKQNDASITRPFHPMPHRVLLQWNIPHPISALSHQFGLPVTCRLTNSRDLLHRLLDTKLYLANADLSSRHRTREHLRKGGSAQREVHVNPYHCSVFLKLNLWRMNNQCKWKLTRSSIHLRRALFWGAHVCSPLCEGDVYN